MPGWERFAVDGDESRPALADVNDGILGLAIGTEAAASRCRSAPATAPSRARSRGTRRRGAAARPRVHDFDGDGYPDV